jgi:WD40 repeat protein
MKRLLFLFAALIVLTSCTYAQDYRQLRLYKTLRSNSKAVSLAFAADRPALLAGIDGKVVLWESEWSTSKTFEAKEVRNFKYPEGKRSIDPGLEERLMYCVKFLPDGKRVAAGCADGTVRLWDIETGKETILSDPSITTQRWTARAHEDAVKTIVISPDGKRLVSGSLDRFYKMWDLATSKLTWTSDMQNYFPKDAAFSKDGKVLTTLSVKPTRPLGPFEDPIRGEVKVRNGITGEAGPKLELRGLTGYVAALAPDGSSVVGQGDYMRIGGQDTGILVWDISTMSLVGPMMPYYAVGGQNLLAISPDGKLVLGTSDAPHVNPRSRLRRATKTTSDFVGIWDIPSRQSLTAPQSQNDPPVEIRPNMAEAVAVSANNDFFAFSGHDGTIQVWAIPLRP